MRLGSLVVFLVWCPGLAAASIGNHPVPKNDGHIEGIPDPSGRIAGDTIEEAWVIPTLPFSGSDDTCEFVNDYAESCPYTGSLSPDVVYAYTATGDYYIDIDLCYSLYDTQLYVYENEYTPGDPYACNDDYYWADPCYTYSSAIFGLPIYAGNTYYIVIDGYGGDCGTYAVDIWEHPMHPLSCPGGSLEEGEPECGEDYVDEYNGGCNYPFPRFQTIDPGQGALITFCGESGTFLFEGYPYRDTDWLEITVEEQSEITFCTVAEFEFQVILIDGNQGCGGLEIIEMETAGYMEEICIAHDFSPGTYWFWVGPSGFDGWPCPGWQYVLTIDGYVGSPTPAEAGSWGAIKARFR